MRLQLRPFYKCNRNCNHTVAPTFQSQLQLQLLQPCNCYNCKHTRSSSANASTNISNNMMAKTNAMQVQHETMACAAYDANASANMSTNADATSMQCNSKHQCKRRCNIDTSARVGMQAPNINTVYAQACGCKQAAEQTRCPHIWLHATTQAIQISLHVCNLYIRVHTRS